MGVHRGRDDAEYGSAAWLADRLSYGDDGARSLGFEGVRVDDPLTAAEQLTDCLRFLPSESPVADSEAAEGAEVSEFWNNAAWRECARAAFAGDLGGTARLSSGTTAVNTWLRHRSDDADIKRELEVAETNLDADGWVLDADGNRIGSNAGLPEVRLPIFGLRPITVEGMFRAGSENAPAAPVVMHKRAPHLPLPPRGSRTAYLELSVSK